MSAKRFLCRSGHPVVQIFIAAVPEFDALVAGPPDGELILMNLRKDKRF